MIPLKRPLMRYYGGKWRIADWIISYFPEHRVYQELFGGAASVLLQKKPAQVEIYNNLNDEVVNLFRVLRNEAQCQKLISLLHLTPYSRMELSECEKPAVDPVERARRTIVLTCFSFNASKALKRKANTFRTNSTGHHKQAISFQESTYNLWIIAARLKEVIIENKHWKKLFNQHDFEDTLTYADPPYLESSRSQKGNHYVNEMGSLEAHAELADSLKSAKGMVIISHYDCPEYDELYTQCGWEIHTKKARTGAATTGKSVAMESIWLNPAAADAQRQLKLNYNLT